jgi:putative transposase
MAHHKQLKRYHEPGHLHELTFSCYQRRPLLTNDQWRERLSRTIDAAGLAAQCELVAFVFMPEHVHLLIRPKAAEPNLGRYLASVKLPFSKQIKADLVEQGSRLLDTLTVQERPGKACFRFWQEGAGFDRNVFSHEAIVGSIDYIHSNPVNRGLCQRAIEWKWSSARYYLDPFERRQFPGLPFVHGLPADALF